MTLFWINLPARADRRAHMEAQLRALGAAPSAHVRVDAYSPADRTVIHFFHRRNV